MVYLILGAGFEEAEAIVPCDLLRRAGVEVRLAGIGGTDIPGSHGIPVHADCAAEAAELTKADMLILPGGLGGVRSIRGCEPVLCAAREMAQAGKWVALRKGWVRNENALCIAKRGREYIKKRDEGKQHWAQPEACRPAYNAFPLQGNRRKRLCNTT